MAEKAFSIDDLSSPEGSVDALSSRETRPLTATPDITGLTTQQDTGYTANQALRESVLGAAEGVSKTAPMVAGAMTGMRLGAMGPPPLTGLGMTVGTIGGGVAGYFGGAELAKLVPGLSREDLAPYRAGGVTFGETIGFAPMAFGIPQMSGNIVSRFISGIGTSARQAPRAFMASEAGGATGAGVASGVSEVYFPDDPFAKTVAEISGGAVLGSIPRLVINGTTTVLNNIGNIASAVKQGSGEQRAADRLRTILEQNGEDWRAVSKALARQTPGGVKPSAAQMLGISGTRGSPTLSALETSLARSNATFGVENTEQGMLALNGYKNLLKELENIGSPEALRTAAELRQDWFNNLLSGRIATAHSDAAQKISRITQDTPNSRAQIGQIVKTEVEGALKDARDYEKSLWSEAFRDSLRVTRQGEVVLRQLKPNNTVRTFLDFASESTPEFVRYEVKPAVKEMLGRLGVNDSMLQAYRDGKVTKTFLETGRVPDEILQKTLAKETSVQDLINIRSDLLAMARTASSKGESADAALYGKLAESVLDDMATLNTAGYDRARMFSRSLNDNFTRTFAKDITGTVRTGAEKIPAEILVSKAFGQNADMVAMRMKDIEGAVGMIRREYDEAVKNFGVDSPNALRLKPLADLADQRVVSVRDAQERVLRLAAAKSVDPTTGRLNPGALQKFVQENRSMLDQFGVTPDLEDAVKAENVFRSVNDSNSAINRTLRKQTAFSRLLKFENPTDAITSALNSGTPTKNIGQLVRFAKSQGQDAVDGLKSSVYDYAFLKAGGENKFNAAAYEKAIFQPLAPGKPSLVKVLRDNGVMSLTEVKNIRSIINPMKRVEEAMGNRRMLEEVLSGADAATELALRIVGAKMGSVIHGGMGGSQSGGLIAASAGSKALRQIFDKMPNVMTRTVLENATKDPKLMSLLLQKGRTERERVFIARSLHGYLGAAGMNYAPFNEPPIPPEQEQRPRGTPMTTLQRQYPSTKGVPGINPVSSAPPTTAQGPQGAAPQGTARAQLAALFPNDTLAGMMSMQNAPQTPQMPQ
jgi:hypothetical protein